MIYQFAPGARLFGDAQKVGEALTSIHESRGLLTAPDVVEEARPGDSVLHPYFEWDDEAAAEAYREDQARHLIRSVHVIKDAAVAGHVEPVCVRAFIQVQTEGASSYEPLAIVVTDRSLRNQAISSVLQDIRDLRRKLQNLEILANTLPSLDAFQDAVERQLDSLPDAA